MQTAKQVLQVGTCFGVRGSVRRIETFDYENSEQTSRNTVNGRIAMSKTKKPQRVTILYEEIKSYTPSFTCPACHVEYKGYGPGRNVLRFKCECGQELIVNNPRPKTSSDD